MELAHASRHPVFTYLQLRIRPSESFFPTASARQRVTPQCRRRRFPRGNPVARKKDKPTPWRTTRQIRKTNRKTGALYRLWSCRPEEWPCRFGTTMNEYAGVMRDFSYANNSFPIDEYYFASFAALSRSSGLTRTLMSGLEYTNRMMPFLSTTKAAGTGATCEGCCLYWNPAIFRVPALVAKLHR